MKRIHSILLVLALALPTSVCMAQDPISKPGMDSNKKSDVVDKQKKEDAAQQKVKTKTKGGNLCPDDNHPHAIDLGLPSGTKWACCNIGAKNPEGYGTYYAWGDTEARLCHEMDLNNYVHYDPTTNSMRNIGASISGTAYDVAHQLWKGNWRMPTVEECQELVKVCKHTRATYRGIKGVKITGTNGNSIFLPAAGWPEYGRKRFQERGSSGAYWSGSKHPSYAPSSFCLDISVNNYDCSVNGMSWRSRETGQSVRAINK